MEDIKKINPALLSMISIVVFTISFIGAPYIFAQTQPVYYCKAKTVTTTDPDIRYFQCDTNLTFSVSTTGGARYNCEISTDEPFCKYLTVPSAINTTGNLGNAYCGANGWAYYPSPATPSSEFQCKAAPTSSGEFDFSLSNLGDKSVSQGQSITNTITAKLESGVSAPVSFNVSELPPESTASTSPTSCTPSGGGTMTCATTINILTTVLTPPSTYPVTVVGISEAPGLGFPNQETMAFGYCNGVTTSFYGKISINNRNSSLAKFEQTSFTKSCPTCNLDSAPSYFEVPANTILTKGGFGNITYQDYGCRIEVPGNPYGSGYGSATYSITVGSTPAGTVTYSWNYPI